MRPRGCASTWMSGFLEAAEVTIGLVIPQAQLRMERPEDQVEPGKPLRIHVPSALGCEIHLDAPEDSELGAAGVDGGDVLALCHEARLVHSVGDAKGFR